MKFSTFVFFLPLFALANTPTLPKNIIDFTNKIYPNQKIINYTFHDDILGGVHQVRTKKSDLIISKDLKTFFPAKNSLLTKNHNNSFEQVFIEHNLNPYTAKKAFSIGEGKKILFAFISPTCVYSNNLISNIIKSQKLLKKYKINFFFFLNKDHKNNFDRLSEQLALHTINSKHPKNKYIEIINTNQLSKYNFLNISSKKRIKLINKLNSSYNLAKILGMSATPSIFEDNAKPFYFKKGDFK